MQYAEQPANHDKDKPQQEGEKAVQACQVLRPVGGKEQFPGFRVLLRQRGVQAFLFGQENARGQGQHHAQKGRAPH